MISMRLRRLSNLMCSSRDFRYAGLDVLRPQGIPEPIGGVAPVVKQPLCLRQIVQQRRRTGAIADLPGGHEEAQGASVCIGDSVKLRVHAAFGAPDQPPEILFS